MRVIEPSFKSYVKLYKSKNPMCGRLGKLYVHNNNELVDIGCNQYDCAICRPIKKYLLFVEILKNVYSFNLQKHFIITFVGKNHRKQYSWIDSYKVMNYEWTKFRLVLNRRFGKVSYILLPRAQKSGYCHFHILTNKFMSWHFLNEKRKRYKFGFLSIQKNKNVAEYLNQDYFKDHEWIIPPGIRHYRSSRNIKLNNSCKDENNIFFTHNTSLETIKKHLLHLQNINIDINEYYIKKIIDNINNS